MGHDTQLKIIAVTDALKEFLCEKNRRYGDSAINPMHVFSKELPSEQLCVRLDDKLSRIRNGDELRKNDVVDTLGYMILLCIYKDWLDFEDQID